MPPNSIRFARIVLMVRFRTTLGVSMGVGLTLGGVVVGYMMLTHQDDGVASAGGSQPLEMQQAAGLAGDTTADSLSVRDANPENVLGSSTASGGTSSGIGGAQGPPVSGGSGTNSGGGSTPGSSAAANLPAPKDFKIYEEYADKESAYMGDIVKGTGAEAGLGSILTVKYKGWLSTGVMFDENYTKDPFAFKLGDHRVILGWEQGLFGMKAGGKRRLIVPAKVGYGPTGQGAVPPNAMMIFDVELLDVKLSNA